VGTVTSVALTVGGDAISVSGSPLTTSGTLGLTFNGTTAQYIRGNGTLETFPTSLISGTGNVNAIPKFTANTVLGNSVMEDDGNFVSMRGLKLNLIAGTGNSINFQQASGIIAAGLGYSSIGAAGSTGIKFYLDQNVTTRSFVLDTTTITSDTERTYSMPNSSGTLALTSDIPSLTGYVPYTGATANVDLGTHTLIAAKGTFSSSGSGDTVGITHSSGSGIALNITKGGNGEGLYINKTSGSGNAATIIGTLNATTLVKSGGTSAQFLKADGSVDSTAYGTGSVTSVGLSSATSGVTIGSTPITTSGTITLAIATASGSQQGLLSSTDWTTFNNKQNALTNPVTGTGTTNYLPKFTGASTIGNSQIFDNGNVGINQTTLFVKLSVADSLAATSIGSNYNPGIINIQNTNTTNGNLSLIGFQDASAFINLAAFGAINEVHSGSPNNVKGSLAFYTKNSGTSYVTEQMRLDASGNLGLGVTPSAWFSGTKALQINGGSMYAANTYTFVGSNIVYTDAGDKYINTGFATVYGQLSGEHRWYNAPSGTAGNAISFTQAMTLDASGRLGIGTTSPSNRLDVLGTAASPNLTGSNAYARFYQSGGFANITIGALASGSFAGWLQSSDGVGTALPLAINPNGGNVGIGTTAPSGKLHIAATTGVATPGSIALAIRDEGNSGFGFDFNLEGVATGDLSLMRTESNTQSQVMTFKRSNGNVGIGTTSPSTKLEVIGYGTANSIMTYPVAKFYGTGTGGLNIGTDGTNPQIATDSSGADLTFLTRVAGVFYERMRLNSNGNLTVYSAETTSIGAINSNNTNGNYGYYSEMGGNTNNTSSFHFVGAISGVGNKIQICGNGNVQNTNNSYGAISDISLKENIIDTTSKLADLLKVKIRNYNLIGDDKKQIGVIAQELETIFPSMIDTDSITGLKSVKYSVFVPMLIKAIQELKQELDTLKNK
jgi:hypothetical protein